MEAQAAWREDGAMPTRREERNMNLSQVLLWWRAAPARRAPRPATPDWVNAGSEPNPEQLDDVLMGCGWFDSSHELNTGLQVTEHLTPERVVNEVPLGWWLDWQAHGPSEAGAQGRHSG
jgi:hypothetical protein